jgi:hypothetical protein
MIGPIVKIADEDLPKRKNIHYLGGKDYKDLPKYIAGMGRGNHALCNKRIDQIHQSY